MEEVYTVNSYAKINIGLKIIGKRSDGYHDIETVFKVIDLHDVISLRVNDTSFSRIITSDENLPTDATNIALKAVHLLEKETGRTFALDIQIDKRIPMGAGLGGGSSNAAGVLTGINRWMDLGLSDDKLMELGLLLGSDVPFFVGSFLGKGHTAVGKGRGELLDYFDWPLMEGVVIVNPGIHVSTAWAYQNVAAKSGSQTTENKRLSLTKKSKSTIMSALCEKDVFFDNDFESLVFAEYPKIKGLRDILEKKNARLSRMSGSGSTVYGLFDPKVNLTGFDTEFPGYFVHIGKFII